MADPLKDWEKRAWGLNTPESQKQPQQPQQAQQQPITPGVKPPGTPGALYVSPITIDPLVVNPNPTPPPNLGTPEKITAKGINEEWFKSIPTQQTPAPADVAAQANVVPTTPTMATVGQANRPEFNNISALDKANPAYAQFARALLNTDALQSGLVPPDVKSQIQQAVAEQGLSAGRFGQMTQAATVQALGHTSLSLQMAGDKQAIDLAKIGENMRQFDIEAKGKFDMFNSTANQDLDKFVINLNKNVDLSNAQRADQLSQFMADARLKADEFNSQNDQTRQLANRQLSTQVALANTGIKSENDRAAASNYFQAMNAVMTTTAAVDQFFANQKFQFKGANAELLMKMLDYDETRKLNAKKMEAVLGELRLKGEEGNADRASMAANDVKDLQKYAMTLTRDLYLNEAHGVGMSDKAAESIKQTIEALRRTSSLI